MQLLNVLFSSGFIPHHSAQHASQPNYSCYSWTIGCSFCERRVFAWASGDLEAARKAVLDGLEDVRAERLISITWTWPQKAEFAEFATLICFEVFDHNQCHVLRFETLSLGTARRKYLLKSVWLYCDCKSNILTTWLSAVSSYWYFRHLARPSGGTMDVNNSSNLKL